MNKKKNPFLRFHRLGGNSWFRFEPGKESVPQVDSAQVEEDSRLQKEAELTQSESVTNSGQYYDSEDEPDSEHRREEDLANVEAVLFLSKEPLPLKKLAHFAGVARTSVVKRLVRELNERYSKQPSAFRVVEVAGGYQLRTRGQFAPWLTRLQEVPIEVRLSTTALETLAVVARKQPVLRAVIESVRGVQCGEILRQLMERNLVKIVGRSEELGRPFLYGTTKYFLQVFGLNSIEELDLS
ncbi:MAG: SMC-Scp complex subunit ScpB [Thermoguttaceae bacterium]